MKNGIEGAIFTEPRESKGRANVMQHDLHLNKSAVKDYIVN